MTSNKWSFYRILMLVLLCVFILARLSVILFTLQYSNMSILMNLLYPLIFELFLFSVLIFVPSQYRFVAIIPLFYFVISNVTQLVSLFNDFNPSTIQFQLIAQFIIFRIVTVVYYLIFSILLLPSFKHKMKHAFIIGSFMIPMFILYLMNVVYNSRFLDQHSPFEFFYRIVIVNFIISLTPVIFFTLYIIDNANKEVVDTNNFNH